MRALETKLEKQADELRADLECHEKVTIGLVLNHLPEKKESHPTVTAEIEGDEEEVALYERHDTSDSCHLAATAGQRLKARERGRVDESRLPVRAVKLV